ncbi:hypothetical protein WJX72_010590 [[Myrmecia] bisecta]|uniref:Impact N-terminal domain-containing protein n=1 Tax=[Myrmecia] bisecta TaxID=41462 RepID=A0AAW1Q0Z1_9CHLO
MSKVWNRSPALVQSAHQKALALRFPGALQVQCTTRQTRQRLVVFILKRFSSCPTLALGSRALSTAQHAVRAAGQIHPEGYQTLQSKHQHELEAKKSKFLTTAWPVTSATQALGLVQAARQPAASHNCFAYKVGQEYRSSDDGEPGGTAGRPILAAIEGEGLDGVCVLVTRYFGGTKLGAGGLVRAYGGAARECLREAPKCTVRPRVDLQLEAGFGNIGTVYALLDQHQAVRLCEEYTDHGTVRLRVSIVQGRAAGLQAAMLDATSGQVAAPQA